MLTGIFIILLAICGFIMDNGTNSWVAGASLILVPLSIIVFIVGLVTKK